MVGHFWQPGQHVLEISIGIDAASSATFENGVKDGSALSGLGLAYKEPVLFADGCGANGILNQVVIDLHPAVLQKDFQRLPLAQGVIHRDAHQALRQMPSGAFQAKETAPEPP